MLYCPKTILRISLSYFIINKMEQTKNGVKMKVKFLEFLTQEFYTQKPQYS